MSDSRTVPGWIPDSAMPTASATGRAKPNVLANARETLRVTCVASAVALAELVVFAVLAGALAAILLP